MSNKLATATLSPEDQRPLVSVIIPAYNASKFIERTLTSVLNQTYENIEILVVDDGSTDDTSEIVQRFVTIDTRIIFLQQANAGVAAARNYAIAKSKGDFIAPIDADDIWHETNVEKQLKVLVSSDDVGMVYSWSIDIDESDYLTGGARIFPYHGNIYPAMLLQNVIGHASACMIRRSCLEHVGSPYYKTSFLAQKAQGCEDWDLYLRIAENYQVELVPELLVGYRQVHGSMSRQTEQMARSRALALQPIERQFPKVYKCVNNWCVSLAHKSTARENFKQNNYAAAWVDFYKAFQTDPLITLTIYSNWTLFIQLLWRSILSSSKGLSTTKHQTHNIEHSPNTEFHKANILPLPSLTIYIRLIMTRLFPAWIIQVLRMHWLNAQVCPQKTPPKSVSFKSVQKAQLEVQMRSHDRRNCYVDFGQTNPCHLSNNILSPGNVDIQASKHNILLNSYATSAIERNDFFR